MPCHNLHQHVSYRNVKNSVTYSGFSTYTDISLWGNMWWYTPHLKYYKLCTNSNWNRKISPIFSFINITLKEKKKIYLMSAPQGNMRFDWQKAESGFWSCVLTSSSSSCLFSWWAPHYPFKQKWQTTALLSALVTRSGSYAGDRVTD